MPRQKRVEFSGAIYHVMARGNRGSCIVEDQRDRETFLEVLEETVQQTGWEVFAFALMDNHYHLAFKTPEPNLVKGMTWLQGTFTKRHNARHQRYGHLFAGRYKALNVEDGGYLTTLIHYIHLNPIRAGVVSSEIDALRSYSWTSLTDYCNPHSPRRKFLAVKKGISHLQLTDTKRGREMLLNKTLKLSGTEDEQFAQSIRDGWILGSKEFLQNISKHIQTKGTELETGVSSKQLRGHSELKAQALIQEGLTFYDLTTQDLSTLKKGDWRKASIAMAIRKNTTLNLEWITQQLHMGQKSGVTKAIRTFKKKVESKEVEKKSVFFSCHVRP